MATIPTPEQGKPILDFSAGTFDGSSNLFQSRNGATEHVSGDDVADYVNTSRIYNGLDTESKTTVGAINEVNSDLADKMDKDNPTGTGSFSLNRKDNTTIGTNSFAEGKDTTASGNYSHAEGRDTTASGNYSHVEGVNTTANHRSQHVMGEYNVLDDSTAAATERGNYVEIVGNGTADSSRSNARTLDWSGNEVLAGTIEATGFGATLKQAVINEITPTDNPLFYAKTYSYTVESIAANASLNISSTGFGIANINGYTAFAVSRVGVSDSRLAINTFNSLGASIVLSVKNTTTDVITNTTFSIRLIYVKSNFLKSLT